MQRHHRALAETDQRELRLVETVPRKLLVDEAVENRRGRQDAPQDFGRIEPRDREPLIAETDVAALRRIGRDEGRIRQKPLPVGREADEIVAVGAVAMGENDELFRPAARRRHRRPGQCRHSRHLVRFIDFVYKDRRV